MICDVDYALGSSEVHFCREANMITCKAILASHTSSSENTSERGGFICATSISIKCKCKSKSIIPTPF